MRRAWAGHGPKRGHRREPARNTVDVKPWRHHFACRKSDGADISKACNVVVCEMPVEREVWFHRKAASEFLKNKLGEYFGKYGR